MPDPDPDAPVPAATSHLTHPRCVFFLFLFHAHFYSFIRSFQSIIMSSSSSSLLMLSMLFAWEGWLHQLLQGFAPLRAFLDACCLIFEDGVFLIFSFSPSVNALLLCAFYVPFYGALCYFGHSFPWRLDLAMIAAAVQCVCPPGASAAQGAAPPGDGPGDRPQLSSAFNVDVLSIWSPWLMALLTASAV